MSTALIIIIFANINKVESNSRTDLKVGGIFGGGTNLSQHLV